MVAALVVGRVMLPVPDSSSAARDAMHDVCLYRNMGSSL